MITAALAGTKSACSIACVGLMAVALGAAQAWAAEGGIQPHGAKAVGSGVDRAPGRIFRVPDVAGGRSAARWLLEALGEARKLKQVRPAEGVVIELGEGRYELSEPLQFTPADSGLTIRARTGSAPILSGGRQITNWSRAKGMRWTAELPDVKAGRWCFRQFVVNDQRAVRARWPNAGCELRIATVADGVKSFTFNRALLGENFGGQDAELVVCQNWSVSRARVASSEAQCLVTDTPVGMTAQSATMACPGMPAFIENIRAGLDQPGEWFLDCRAGLLTYLAREGGPPPDAVAPVLTQLVRITGTKHKPVRELRFEGVCFEHTDFPLPAAGYGEIQAAHYGSAPGAPTHVQPVAVECAYAEGVRFEHCRFAHLNNSAIGFGPGCRSNALTGCVIEDIGGTGVMIGWRGTGEVKDGPEGKIDGDWADPADVPVANEVANCVIRRCGADSFGAVGVFAAFSAQTRIAHNHIYDLPYSGISLGYRWDATPTSQVRCVAEYNHIHDVMKQLTDGGGIYTLGLQPGTVLRGNLIHDVQRSAWAYGGAQNNGFFIDEGSKGFLFESNVVYKTSGGAVRHNQNSPEWHTWKDNSFDGDATPAVIESAARLAGVEPGFSLPADPSPGHRNSSERGLRPRRVLYNFDGDSCLTTKAGSKGPGPVNAADVKRLIEEVAYDGSRVDTIMVCVNAQVMYYPTKVGTMRGTLSTSPERGQWPVAEQQRCKNLQAFFDAGADPYAIMLAEARRHGREALLTFRMNDDHGDDYLRTQFKADHPDWLLGGERYHGRDALDFGRDEVRDHTARLIEEAVRRYDSDGLELDFNRFPNFFKDGTPEQHVAKMNSLVERVWKILGEVGREGGRRLVLAVRVPSNYGVTPPTPDTARQLGCDVAAWVRNGWVDYVVVSEFLFERGDLPIGLWKQAIPTVPVYGGIECTRGGGQKNLSADEYRRAAAELVKQGADGVYLFNFFTSREEGANAYEPPFEVLRELGASPASK